MYIHLFRPRYKHLVVNNSTALIIDGFPRSANTFAVVAFEAVQKKTVVIAHHTHVPATIIDGCKSNLPVLLLIRDPLSCVASASIYLETNPIPLLKEWLWFYKSCFPFIDRLTIAPFQKVINHYDQIIISLNKKFNVNFSLFHHEAALLSSVNHRIKEIAKAFGKSELQVARPSNVRKHQAEQIKAVILREHKMLKKAQKLHEQYLLCGCRQNITGLSVDE